MSHVDSNQKKSNFRIGFIPGAVLGMFGIRTEEEMQFESILNEGKFSLRKYLSHTELIAPKNGTQKRAVNKAFNSLFSYIDGENQESKEFAMTTPVLSRKKGDNRWDVSFYLKGAACDLPKPNQTALSIREMPAQTYAAIQFSGNITDLEIKNMTFELEQFIKHKGIKVRGKPVVAQYDQPFAIPFLKRNEILIPVKWDNAWSSSH